VLNPEAANRWSLATQELLSRLQTASNGLVFTMVQEKYRKLLYRNQVKCERFDRARIMVPFP
jgi:hypothetical protein